MNDYCRWLGSRLNYFNSEDLIIYRKATIIILLIISLCSCRNSKWDILKNSEENLNDEVDFLLELEKPLISFQGKYWLMLTISNRTLNDIAIPFEKIYWAANYKILHEDEYGQSGLTGIPPYASMELRYSDFLIIHSGDSVKYKQAIYLKDGLIDLIMQKDPYEGKYFLFKLTDTVVMLGNAKSVDIFYSYDTNDYYLGEAERLGLDDILLKDDRTSNIIELQIEE